MNRAELIARVEALEKEQWLVAECIFQNVSAGEMKHWAQGIKVSLSGADKVPRFTVETPAEPKLCDCIALCRESNSAWKCPPGDVCKLTTQSDRGVAKRIFPILSR